MTNSVPDACYNGQSSKRNASGGKLRERKKGSGMKQLIEKIIKTGMEQFMDKTRAELKSQDNVYLKDMRDTAYLEQRYMELDLSKKQRMIIGDYIACMQTANNRYVDISYIAGIMDAVRCLSSWGSLKI
jgi:hypothetical protein